MKFYVTTAANMPHGCGYWEVNAKDKHQARGLAFLHCPEGRWSFIYESLDDVHEMDRKCHGVIGGEVERAAQGGDK